MAVRGGSAAAGGPPVFAGAADLEKSALYWLQDVDEVYVPAQFIGQAHATLPQEGMFRLLAGEAGGEGPSFQANVPTRVCGRIVDEWHLTHIHKDMVRNDDVSEPNILWALKRRFFSEGDSWIVRTEG